MKNNIEDTSVTYNIKVRQSHPYVYSFDLIILAIHMKSMGKAWQEYSVQ